MIADLGRALGQLSDPRFRGVLWRGVALAAGLLGALSAALLWLLGWLLPDAVAVPWIGDVGWLDDLAGWALVPVLAVLSLVLMVPVASAMTGLFLDDVAEAVEARHYPRAPPARRQGIAEGAREGLGGLAVALGLNLLALPVYLVAAPLAPVLFLALNGWLIGREHLRAAALRRGNPAAARDLLARHRGRAWALGCLVAPVLLVPGVNLAVPVIAAAAFTHLYWRIAASP